MPMTVVRVWLRVGIATLLGMACPLQGANRPLATGHVPAIVKHVRATGDLPDATPMNLAIGLPLRNSAALQSWLSDVYNPASTNYLYFVSDGNGHHRFSDSLEEHNRNVAAYRKSMEERR